MDAPKSARTALAAVVLSSLLSGCDWLNARPNARPEGNRPAPAPEQPIVVQAAADAAPADAHTTADSEPLNPEVEQFIARVDDVATRVAARRADSRRTPLARPDPSETDNPRAEDAAGDGEPSRHGSARSETEPETATSPAAPAGAAASQPPVLSGVSIRAAASAVPAPPAPAIAPPGVNRPMTSAAPSATAVRTLLDAMPELGENPSFREQLDRRVVQALSGEYEAARQPLEWVTAEQQALAARFVEALIAVREGHPGDPAAAQSRALAAIEGLQSELQRGSDLKLPTIAICSSVTGFGQYTPIDPPVFPAGRESEFVMYCEVRNFVSEPEPDGHFLTRFHLRTRVMNRSGEVVVDYDDPDVVDRCRNRRNDCFIPRLVRLPATLSPGEYVAKISVSDKLGNKLVEGSASFRVAAPR